MTGSRGPLGYADWQRISNYDAPLLSHQGANTFNPAALIGPLDVSRYLKLGVEIANNELAEVPLIVTCLWQTEIGASFEINRRTFVIGTKTEGPGEPILRCDIPNLGPAVKLEVKGSAGGAFTTQWNITANNRPITCECALRGPVLVGETTFTLKSKEAKNVFTNSYYSGTFILRAAATQPRGIVRLQVFSPGAKVWITVDGLETVSAGKEVRATMMAPLGLWRLNLENPEAGEGVVVVWAVASNYAVL